MFSIGQLCKEFHLSRSTLLYYDSIGLLVASERSGVNYRRYSEADRIRLGQICAFREAGVPLRQIKDMLDKEGRGEREILEKRLRELNTEIRYLRLQQKLIVDMLQMRNLSDRRMPMDAEAFTSLLRAAGMEEATLDELHARFEKTSPDAHQFFLEFLGFDDAEIKSIRVQGGRM